MDLSTRILFYSLDKIYNPHKRHKRYNLYKLYRLKRQEWNYYTGSPAASPDRETDFTYLTSSAYTSKHIINLVTDKVVKSGVAAQVAETKTTYDSTALTSVTGITMTTPTTAQGTPCAAIRRWCSAG